MTDEFTAEGLEMLRDAGFPVAGVHTTTVTDRTAATEQEFAARIAPFDIFAEERVIEEVARAIHAADEFGNYPVQNWATEIESNRADYRRLAAAAVAAYRATQDGGAEVARLSPDGLDVAIQRAPNIWHVSNGGHYRDAHVADWTPLATQSAR